MLGRLKRLLKRRIKSRKAKPTQNPVTSLCIIRDDETGQEITKAYGRSQFPSGSLWVARDSALRRAKRKLGRRWVMRGMRDRAMGAGTCLVIRVVGG